MPAKFKKDIIYVLILLVVFILLYNLFLYKIPWQVNTDEITIMIVERSAFNHGYSDILGLASYYFYHPAFVFHIFAWLGKLLGEINLHNMRLVHASFGFLIVMISYPLFRLSLSSPSAGAAAIILGINHALLAISRMAMRENSALLTEISAAYLLMRGFISQSLLHIFLGGVIAGIGFYVYFPGRVTMVIWASFLILNAFIFKIISFKKTLKISLVSSLGFLVATIPLIYSTLFLSHPTDQYERQQLLIFAEGRQMQKEWVGVSTVAEGIKKNVFNGLTVFNNKISDYAYIYPNSGHGFVDPLTGILVWLGVIMVVFQSVRKKLGAFDLFNLIGLFVLLFIFSFISNKAPNYTRLLVILPFAAYFAVKGIVGMTEILKVKTITKYSMVIGILCVIMIWNLAIFYDFVQKGFIEGNDVGGTGRYVESKKNLPQYKFYLVANNSYPYYSWGGEWQWRDWMGFFKTDSQIAEVLSPDNFMEKLGKPPLTVFMNKQAWLNSQISFKARYNQFQIHHIKVDGSLLAIEVKE